jgi:hypothetical protein
LRAASGIGDPVIEIGAGRDVHDHRVVVRPALGFVDARHGGRVFRIRAEAVDGLGRESDQAALFQHGGRVGDLRG